MYGNIWGKDKNIMRDNLAEPAGSSVALFRERMFVCVSEGNYPYAAIEEPKRSQKRAERKQEILNMLMENSTMTQAQIGDYLGLTRKQVQKDIKELQDAGALSREGSNRGGRWIVKEL